MSSQWYDDYETIEEDTGKVAKEIDHRLPGFTGLIDDEFLDELDYEEEFASFEPIKRKGRR